MLNAPQNKVTASKAEEIQRLVIEPLQKEAPLKCLTPPNRDLIKKTFLPMVALSCWNNIVV